MNLVIDFGPSLGLAFWPRAKPINNSSHNKFVRQHDLVTDYNCMCPLCGFFLPQIFFNKISFGTENAFQPKFFYKKGARTVVTSH